MLSADYFTVTKEIFNTSIITFRKQPPDVFCEKKVFLKISQNSQENTCTRTSFLIQACNIIKKEALAQVFSSEFCEISKNTFFIEHLCAAASKRFKNVSVYFGKLCIKGKLHFLKRKVKNFLVKVNW